MASVVHQLTATPMDWQQQAACRALDTEIFFPPVVPEHKQQREARESRAKAICATCPVQEACLDWALRTEEPHGVWGGYSESERKQLLALGPRGRAGR